MPRQQTPADGVTIGFLGTGAMDIDAATDLIEEFIEATISNEEDPVRFIFPLTTTEFSDTMEELVEMAKKSDITYEVITSTSDKGRRAFTEIAASAARTYHVADVFTQLEHVLTEAPKGMLEVLWDKQRDAELTEIVGRFVDAGIDSRDLTDANSPFSEGDDDEPEAAQGESSSPLPQAEDEAEADEAVPIYARSDLEKMSRADVKEIALKLNLPPRKSSAAMIEEILEAQEEAAESPVEAPVEIVETVVGELVVNQAPSLDSAHVEALIEAMEDFPVRVHDMLDEFLSGLGKTLEGVIFNATPEEPRNEAAPARRRLTRSR
jgi:hypothetical protein